MDGLPTREKLAAFLSAQRTVYQKKGIINMESKIVENRLKEARLIAVIRSKDKQEACQQIESLLDKGVRAVEVTYTTPGASDIIESFRNREDILIGAGTVITAHKREKSLRLARSLLSVRVFQQTLLNIFLFKDTLYPRRIDSERNYGSADMRFYYIEAVP